MRVPSNYRTCCWSRGAVHDRRGTSSPRQNLPRIVEGFTKKQSNYVRKLAHPYTYVCIIICVRTGATFTPLLRGKCAVRSLPIMEGQPPKLLERHRYMLSPFVRTFLITFLLQACIVVRAYVHPVHRLGPRDVRAKQGRPNKKIDQINQ